MMNDEFRLGIAVVALGLLIVAGPQVGVEGAVERTVHNLTATGLGAARLAEPGRVCSVCHAPHNASPARGRWSKAAQGVTYKLYESSTLEATLKQPTGSSRVCLSCHDGTLALAAPRGRAGVAPVTFAPLRGKASLGTDLSDDHPISFVYDASLVGRRGQLADPSRLPATVHLDPTRQVQCATCHDPHEDGRPKFLTMDNRASRLCTTCHRIPGWPGSPHATSGAEWRGRGPRPWPEGAPATVAENGCANCHRTHGAPRPQWLLAQERERDICLGCHNGAVASKDLEPDFSRPSRHPIDRNEWVHSPREDPATMRRHVTCTDCHSAHQTGTGRRSAPVLPGSLASTAGITLAGARVGESRFEYEVCLKCHGVAEQRAPAFVRADIVTNLRLAISPANPSFHPLATTGRNPDILGLEPGYTASTLIYCTDCHNSSEAPGGGPRGPHGSRYAPILEREYQLGDRVAEGFQTYALCYKCHNRTTLLSDQRGFPHRAHVVDDQASCATCHDPHGSRRSRALVNFMTRAPAGNPVARPSRSGRLAFESTAPGQGRCFTSCHGIEHDPLEYPRPPGLPALRLPSRSPSGRR